MHSVNGYLMHRKLTFWSSRRAVGFLSYPYEVYLSVFGREYPARPHSSPCCSRSILPKTNDTLRACDVESHGVAGKLVEYSPVRIGLTSERVYYFQSWFAWLTSDIFQQIGLRCEGQPLQRMPLNFWTLRFKRNIVKEEQSIPSDQHLSFSK